MDIQSKVSINDDVLYIKKTLKLNYCFYINFKLEEILSLSDSICRSRGFTLKRVIPHPRKKNTYILEIQCINPENRGLNTSLIHKSFSVNNQKKVTPNLNSCEELKIEEFESKYKVYLGRPKE